MTSNQEAPSLAQPSYVTFHDWGPAWETRPVIDKCIQVHPVPDLDVLYPELCANVEAQISKGATRGDTNCLRFPCWYLTS